MAEESKNNPGVTRGKVIAGVVGLIVVLIGIKVLSRHSDSPKKPTQNATVAAAVPVASSAAKPSVSPAGHETAKPVVTPPTKVEPAKPVATTPIVPYGDGASTIVPLENSGKDPAVVKYVEFEIVGAVFKTPSRSPTKAAGPAIPVTFQLSETHPQLVLRYDLPDAKPAASDQRPTALKLAIVEPRHPGWTYRGKVTVYFAGAPAQTVKQLVELDILKAPPAAKP